MQADPLFLTSEQAQTTLSRSAGVEWLCQRGLPPALTVERMTQDGVKLAEYLDRSLQKDKRILRILMVTYRSDEPWRSVLVSSRAGGAI